MLVVVIRYQGAKLIGTTNQPISDDMKRRIIIFYNPICMKYQIAIEHHSYSSEYLHWISESFTEYSICFNIIKNYSEKVWLSNHPLSQATGTAAVAEKDALEQ